MYQAVLLSSFSMQGGTVARLLQTWSKISRSEACLPRFARLTAALADFNLFCSSVQSWLQPLPASCYAFCSRLWSDPAGRRSGQPEENVESLSWPPSPAQPPRLCYSAACNGGQQNSAQPVPGYLSPGNWHRNCALLELHSGCGAVQWEPQGKMGRYVYCCGGSGGWPFVFLGLGEVVITSHSSDLQLLLSILVFERGAQIRFVFERGAQSRIARAELLKTVHEYDQAFL